MALEPEWDSEDSNAYQDGRERGEADALAGRPFDDSGMTGPRREGYRDGCEETQADAGAAMSTEPVKADRLREARVYLGFSRDEVSGAMGRERRWVDDIEYGRQPVTGEELRKLSRLYRRPIEWLQGKTMFQPDPDLLRHVENLTEGDREAILDFAEFLQGAGPAPVPPAERARRAAWRRSLRTGGSDE